MRRVALALLAILVAPAAPPAAGQEAFDPEQRFERVRTAFGDGRYTEALEGSRELARRLPIALPIQLLHGAIAEYLGEFDEALVALQRARALEPSNPLPHAQLAGLLVRLGHYDEALAHLDWSISSRSWDQRWTFLHGPADDRAELIRQHRDLAAIVQLKIDILMEKGDLAEARRLAHVFGIVRSGEDYCGQVRRMAGTPLSTKWFTALRLATLSPTPDPKCVWWYGQWLNDHGYVRLGHLMVLEGTRNSPTATNKPAGEHYLRVRLAGGRSVAKRAEQLALIGRQRFARDGDEAGAVRLLEEATRLEPTFTRPYLHLAHIAWTRAHHAAALTWLERALQTDPDCWRAHRNLARVLGDLGRHAEAEGRIRKALELFVDQADDVGGRLILARALYAQSKFDDYIRETEKALILKTAPGWTDWSPLDQVRQFLDAHLREGRQATVPPAPDPRVIMGWNFD